jgi:hypothetical protein
VLETLLIGIFRLLILIIVFGVDRPVWCNQKLCLVCEILKFIWKGNEFSNNF